jgi:hypothetical protein
LQVGGQNMQDFNLLRHLGGMSKPIVLRRGPGATVEEFLLAAEYVLVHGNGRVLLCESGIRTFDALDKPRFEINAIPLIKQLSHLPLLADPSQTAPRASAVPPIAKAAVAAGVDGLIVEVGTEATRDRAGFAIDIETMTRVVGELRPIARAAGRPIESTAPPVAAVTDTDDVLHQTDRTLSQTIEALLGRTPHLEVVDQWSEGASLRMASPPLSSAGRILARCTSYRIGDVRLSRNLAFVDLATIDPTLGALLESEQLNLGQLFVDPRIEKRNFEFGTDETAADVDDVLRRCFPAEAQTLHPYVWRRYHAAIAGTVTFVVIETLPVRTWDQLLGSRTTEQIRA